MSPTRGSHFSLHTWLILLMRNSEQIKIPRRIVSAVVHLFLMIHLSSPASILMILLNSTDNHNTNERNVNKETFVYSIIIFTPVSICNLRLIHQRTRCISTNFCYGHPSGNATDSARNRQPDHEWRMGDDKSVSLWKSFEINKRVIKFLGIFHTSQM